MILQVKAYAPVPKGSRAFYYTIFNIDSAFNSYHLQTLFGILIFFDV